VLEEKEACCSRMWREIDDFRQKVLNKDGSLESTIWYEEDTRTYNLLSLKRLDEYGKYDCAGWPIDYCPFCGTKLPIPLDPEEVIYEEYGEDYVRYTSDPKYKELPPKIRKEFDSDEWWKKRGL